MDANLPVFLPDLDLGTGAGRMPAKIPHGAYRHAAPPGPWPWQDVVEDVPFNFNFGGSQTVKDEDPSDESSPLWLGYPSRFFSNWTRVRLERSGLASLIGIKPSFESKTSVDRVCIIYNVDLADDGHFSEPGQKIANDDDPGTLWRSLKEDDYSQRRARVISVENMSGNVLQMLGTMYRIEPFFFSSSLNWIPSRYQEDVRPGEGDHITVTLTFLRTMPNPMTAPNTPMNRKDFMEEMLARVGTATIDTQAPLTLRSSDRILLLDLLAMHMVRRQRGSTIITFHPSPEWKSTSAQYLQSRVRYAGESVYWQNVFRRSPDPTLVLICILWYAMYAWDESLENLYSHICYLESRVLVTNDIHLTRELHIIRASLLHYTSLLDSFRKTVQFIRGTPNPSMEGDAQYQEATWLMDRECNVLLSEIDRLEMFRKIQEMRLENIINLAFNSVNFEDSRGMQRLTEAALRDSAVMRQISYLTMIFLPATFVATVFGMNITDLSPDTRGRLTHYLVISIPLTVVTIWMLVALHGKPMFEGDDSTFLGRLRWPIQSAKELLRWRGRRVHVGVV